jgi:hypothetical protein
LPVSVSRKSAARARRSRASWWGGHFLERGIALAVHLPQVHDQLLHLRGRRGVEAVRVPGQGQVAQRGVHGWAPDGLSSSMTLISCSGLKGLTR